VTFRPSDKDYGFRPATGAVPPAPLWAWTVLTAAVVLAYARSLSAPFVLDDIPSVAENPTIRAIGSAFHPPLASTEAGRPVLNLSMAADYAISRTSTWSYHASNVLVLILSALALLGIVRMVLASRGDPEANRAGFAVAAIWALHPLLTGSVTYVSQRAESLMGLWFLLTLYCFARAALNPGARSRLWLSLAAGACLLGMGTKEVMAVAPVVLLLFDRTFVCGTFAAALKRRTTFYLCIAATWIPLALLVLSSHGRGDTAGFGSGLPWTRYALTQFVAIIHYIRLALWPSGLVFDYGSALAAPSAAAAACTAAVCLLVVLAAAGLRFEPAAGFLGASFFLILAPSSSVVPVSTETLAEHRMYLPLIAVVILCVCALRRWMPRAYFPVGLAAALVLGACTFVRNGAYASPRLLWEDTVRKLPSNDRAHNSLGNAYLEEGRRAEAKAQYEEALGLNPSNADARINLGNLIGAEGNAGEAEAQIRSALKLIPNSSNAHNNLGNVLQKEGRRKEAEAEFENAVSLDPGNAQALNNLATSLASSGRLAEAITRYREAVSADPAIADVHANLGNALLESGQREPAEAEYREALRLAPSSAGSHNNLGNALSAEGRTAEAAAEYAEAVSRAPDVAGFRLNLAVALLRLPGREPEAVPQLYAALRIDPDNAPAKQILSRLQAAGR
jgi:Tfp pilus assembly protein PilF